MHSVPELVQRHFREKAFSFDSLYEAPEDSESLFQRTLRPALFARRAMAVRAVEAHGAPRVLDVGCGSGRVAELMLRAGAASYVGVDFSEPMIELCGRRLARFGDRVALVQGDFTSTVLPGPFDVVVALGLFDYVEDPSPLVRRFAQLTDGCVVASFPCWSWLKGPIRKIRYELLHRCPIFDYTEREISFLFRAAGFRSLELTRVHAGVLLCARK